MNTFYLKSNKENEHFIENKSQNIVFKAVSEKNNYFNITDVSNNKIGEIHKKRDLLMPADLPKFTVKLNDGKEIIISKDIKNFQSSYEICGEDLVVKDNLFDDEFKIYRKDIHLANVKRNKTDSYIEINLINDKALNLVSCFMFALNIIFYYEKL